MNHLRRALDHRGAIDQAKGILMALVGCDQDDAFKALVGVSQRRNLKLYDVACELTEVAAHPDPGPLTRWVARYVGRSR